MDVNDCKCEFLCEFDASDYCLVAWSPLARCAVISFSRDGKFGRPPVQAVCGGHPIEGKDSITAKQLSMAAQVTGTMIFVNCCDKEQQGQVSCCGHLAVLGKLAEVEGSWGLSESNEVSFETCFLFFFRYSLVRTPQ